LGWWQYAMMPARTLTRKWRSSYVQRNAAKSLPLSPLYPTDSWYMVGIVWAALLFGESLALLFLLRGVRPAWPQRLLAGVLALGGIWSVVLSIWVWVDPRTYIFHCSLGAPDSPPPFVETSPPLVHAQGMIEDVTNYLVPLLLLLGLGLAYSFKGGASRRSLRPSS